MVSTKLLNTLHRLSRADKLRVIQLLVSDLAAEEEAFFTPGATYEVWSPYDAPEAAQTLVQILDDEQPLDG
jgi:hypothetical protein